MAGQIIVQRGAVGAGGGGGTPGGSNTQVQYNDGGAFGGDAGLTFDETSDILTVVGGLDIAGDAGLLRLGASQDLVLARDAADILAQRRGTNAQVWHQYKTFTDTSNYERLRVGWNSANVSYDFEIQKAGTGGNVNMAFRGTQDIYFIPATNRNTIFQSPVLPDGNNTRDIGSPESAYSQRWRDVWIQGSYNFDNSNHAHGTLAYVTELTTIAAAATTDTTIQAPANSLVLGVSVRVTVAIPTAATFDIGVAGATTRYGTGVSTAATTTNTSPGTTNPSIYAAATSIRFTPNATPGANTGRVRTTIYYFDMDAPLN